MPSFFIDRPIFAWVVAILISLGGVLAILNLGVESYPTIAPPQVVVNATYPGASAQVVESQITTPIEEQLSGIEGIDYIGSVSREESSQITVRFRLDRDPDSAAADVRDRVALARDFLPQEAREPVVQKQEADAQPIIYLAFSSDRHSELEIADIADRLVKDRVQNLAGVAQAPLTFAATPLTRTITGLTPGTAYTFRVFATNSRGTGIVSAASNPVTPT